MTDQSTAERVAELKKLAEAATPGPWKFSRESWNVSTPDCEIDISVYIPQTCEDMTGEFIAAANPQAILSLIGHIAELERKNAELERQLASMAQGVKISIPTATMEYEFQSYYRRGYAAGIAASHQKEDKA